MLVVTNYPQVPLATSNVATDSARVENQQRPPIVPPPQLTKGHEERAFNPQHERTADEPQVQARLQKRVEEKQQQHQQQQHKDAEQQSQQALPRPLKRPAKTTGALSRSDLKVKSQPQEPRHPLGSKTASPQAGLPDSFYRAIASHVDSFYHHTSEPRAESTLSSWV
ncbi:hypothetical protein SHAM105786_13275 [Shewanella amazonensis]|uniref:Uncharacterized protein n=1 Tax=Shewanella amazonensis (strain ATCC BAA-1098 / SB2B) TaxID=326297 RepID=A1SBF2_SHEAM|nr:hypothetical protein [Shewanella amazonensis]ABM01709.1 conserved hypothetical protein [Shewanella amazonensis SB2B]